MLVVVVLVWCCWKASFFLGPGTFRQRKNGVLMMMLEDANFYNDLSLHYPPPAVIGFDFQQKGWTAQFQRAYTREERERVNSQIKSSLRIQF